MQQDKTLLQARVIYYHLFSHLFIYQGSLDIHLDIIRILKILQENSLDEPSKEASTRLLSKLDPTSNATLIDEYNNIFYNPETKNVRTTASFYDEGFESGKKRVEMQRFLAKTKIRRNEESFSEYEDSFPFIMAILAQLNGLVMEGEEEYVNTTHCIFDQILNEFVEVFAKNVYEHKDADIFKDVIIILKSFIGFERLYLNVATPIPKAPIKKPREEDISDEERERRERNKRLRLEENESPTPAPDTNTVYDFEDGVD